MAESGFRLVIPGRGPCLADRQPTREDRPVTRPASPDDVFPRGQPGREVPARAQEPHLDRRLREVEVARDVVDLVALEIDAVDQVAVFGAQQIHRDVERGGPLRLLGFVASGGDQGRRQLARSRGIDRLLAAVGPADPLDAGAATPSSRVTPERSRIG